MPTATDLRRLAEELDRAGQASTRSGLLIGASEVGAVDRAEWRDGQVSVWVRSISTSSPAVVRKAPLPGDVGAFLRAEAALSTSQAADKLETAPAEAENAEIRADIGKRSSEAADLLRRAATLEEVASACDRNEGVVTVHTRQARNRKVVVVCVDVAGIGHVVFNGAWSSYYGVVGACRSHWASPVCARGAIGDYKAAVIVNDYDDQGVRAPTTTPQHPIGVFLSQMIANLLRGEAIGITSEPPKFLERS